GRGADRAGFERGADRAGFERGADRAGFERGPERAALSVRLRARGQASALPRARKAGDRTRA
ncbi:hypothetical protein ABT369_04000, partial [Dactylosporangium sp. NPDC000244]|uniref:hypothetical protein n=1 Tax=Dactylosporangium sp. NPDC000244 TaxID=3154365 RepID=UPI0033338FD9